LRALVVEDFAGCAAACTSHGPAHAKSNIKQRVCTVRIFPFPKVGSKTRASTWTRTARTGGLDKGRANRISAGSRVSCRSLVSYFDKRPGAARCRGDFVNGMSSRT
jgi:hypothetical protein